MDEQRHNAIELPKGLYEPVLRQPMELDFLLGQELSLCFHDLDGSHVFKTCYGDICKAVNALRDYARLLEMACEQWDLTGFHRALYEYHAEKMREIAGKFQAGIGYDYDAAMEKCRRKKKRKKKEDDLDDVKQEILSVVAGKLEAGVSKDTIYKAIESVAGVKNPNAIKDIATAQKVVEQIKKLEVKHNA